MSSGCKSGNRKILAGSKLSTAEDQPKNILFHQHRSGASFRACVDDFSFAPESRHSLALQYLRNGPHAAVTEVKRMPKPTSTSTRTWEISTTPQF
jgi:hypothetical protein